MKPNRAKQVRDFLEPITSKIKRKRFLVFDIESKRGDTQEPGFTRPFLVGLFDPKRPQKKKSGGGDGYQEFRDEPQLKSRPWERRHILPGGCVDKLLVTILTKAYSGSVFYAHNGGNFDHLFVLTWLQEHREDYGFEVIPVQSSIQMIKVWRVSEDPEKPSKEHWEFLDSMKLLPMGLDKACKTFNLPGKVDFDLSVQEDDPRWSLYLKQDCVALATVMTRLYNMVEKLGGEVGITTPSTAMKLFRRRFMGSGGCPNKISRWSHWAGCQDKTNGKCLGCAHNWIRLGYYGGRTEPFCMEGTSLKYFDINSSYVSSMRRMMPIGDRMVELGKLDWRKHYSLSNPKGRHSGFCECTVYIPPDCQVPPLPHRDKKTRRLTFPTGRFHGVWSLEELALLRDPFVNGSIEHVVKTVWFRLEPMFREMVDELWKLRDPKLAGFEEGLSALAKLLGNGAYGKFAMRQERTSIVFTKKDSKEGCCFLCGEPDPKYDGDTTKETLCPSCDGSKPASKEPDGDVWYQSHIVDAPYIIPQVASHITALSRVVLWQYMKMAVEMGGKIYYVDTDSLITDVDLPTSTLLGEMKDEYPGERLSFLAVQPKVYLLEKMEGGQPPENSKKVFPQVTMKGFPQRTRTKPNFELLRAGETIAWEQLEKVRSLARANFRRPPKMRAVKKSFKTGYDKRILLADGINTRAIVLDEPIGGYRDDDDTYLPLREVLASSAGGE